MAEPEVLTSPTLLGGSGADEALVWHPRLGMVPVWQARAVDKAAINGAAYPSAPPPGMTDLDRGASPFGPNLHALADAAAAHKRADEAVRRERDAIERQALQAEEKRVRNEQETAEEQRRMDEAGREAAELEAKLAGLEELQKRRKELDGEMAEQELGEKRDRRAMHLVVNGGGDDDDCADISVDPLRPMQAVTGRSPMGRNLGQIPVEDAGNLAMAKAVVNRDGGEDPDEPEGNGSEADERLAALLAMLEKTATRFEKLLNEVERLRDHNSALRNVNGALQERVDELEQRLSGRPPRLN
jgi:hypothetical protein